MILPVNNIKHNINFSAGSNEKEKKSFNSDYDHDTLLPSTTLTNIRIGMDKLTNAFTLYPAKGLKGSKNANFYEFLTMGTVPYIIGSLGLMAVFNFANKFFSPFDKVQASKIGQKMALGVVLYGVFKSLSKQLISRPVNMLTGVDTDQPYAKVNYELPDHINDTDITSIEYHKVFESVEFPRWDLLYGDETKGEKRNFRYDKIAKKLNMGDNLNDSDQETKPRIKEIIVKSNLAKSISSYLWAATGVALAFQQPWEEYFKVMTFKFWKPKEFLKSLKIFGRSFVNSAKNLYKGDGRGIAKHAGKILLGVAALSSIFGVINTVAGVKKSPKSNSKVINPNEKHVVS